VKKRLLFLPVVSYRLSVSLAVNTELVGTTECHSRAVQTRFGGVVSSPSSTCLSGGGRSFPSLSSTPPASPAEVVRSFSP
jgi:hypothetical protein